jgi:GNAT superfamily N-acetyltransferase
VALDIRTVLVAAVGGDTVAGTALVVMPQRDNTHFAQYDVRVRPDHRRRGVGTALAEHCEVLAAQAGRQTLLADVLVAPEGGPDDDRHAAWALRRGFTVANTDGVKVCDLAAEEHRLPALEAHAAERLGEYRLAWWVDPAPEEHVASLAAAMSRFLGEIPLGELDLRPQAFDPQRIRAGEARRAAQRRQKLTVVALAPDGEVAGFTDAQLSPHAPRLADIGSTLVLADHRGHRLGLAVKVLLHRQLRALHPGAELLETSNATTNRWMNDVNDQLGYRLVARLLELQKVTA